MARRFIDYQRRLTPRARTLRRDSTPAERKLWFDYLRNLPEKFTRQKPLGRYIADFYCAEHRLVIEIDGDSHFDSKGEAHDARRTTAMNLLGIRILRFTNADVMQTFEGVCMRIRSFLDT